MVVRNQFFNLFKQEKLRSLSALVIGIAKYIDNKVKIFGNTVFKEKSV
jgi:hypothetical protein